MIKQDGDWVVKNELGQFHCLDGPAHITRQGDIFYIQNDKLHRTDGPAYIGKNGLISYWQHDDLHRLDGPAVALPNGTVQYWVNGQIPTTILDLIITDREMVFRGKFVPEVRYPYQENMHAYRFYDMDELALAVLHYG
jgi:hypothetical protein